MQKLAIKFLFLLSLSSCVQINTDGTKVAGNNLYSDSINQKTNSENEFFSFYYLKGMKVKLTDQRPSQADTSIKLCIPVAFTQLDDGSIDGLFILDGKIVDRKKVNHHLGGGFLITNDKISIFKTDDGKVLTENWIDSISNLKGSFFQQIQLVRNGENLEFHKDQKLFQRRAIAIFNGGQIAMVESKSPITLQEFADDLVKMKVIDAIYTDMGSYDEGWLRSLENNKISVIGHNRMETQNQSNWLIFTR